VSRRKTRNRRTGGEPLSIKSSRERKSAHGLLQATLPIAGAMDLASYNLRPAVVRQTGARIIRLLTTIAARSHSQAPVHLALQHAWSSKVVVGEAIRIASVLVADHEGRV
jgi:hypothetical protein